MAETVADRDPRTGRRVPADFVVAQPGRYSLDDHATWRFLYRRQRELLRGRIVDDFFTGLEALHISDARIPDFGAMSETLYRATGWRVVAVPGLVPDAVFFAHLAARRFPAGYWIRRPEERDYIEEPDVFHDVFGHVPLLMLPHYADYVAAYGRAGLALADSGDLERLARLYWYTVEFGLMKTQAGLRIFGAGIASSASETVYALESSAPERLAFDCEQVLRTRYEIDALQRTYFVLDGWNDLPSLETGALRRRLDAVGQLPDLLPRVVSGPTVAMQKAR